MAVDKMNPVIRGLYRVLLRDGGGKTDADLLKSFIDHNDQLAFEALVCRHGPMVFGVCRRVIGNHHDAEDAFQATFLVLARKASSVRPRDRLASWLHGVAIRTAMKATAMATKRRRREKLATEIPERETPEREWSPHDHWVDLKRLIDQELNGLPENYRLPILLCDLEGRTIKEATQCLGWAQGTLAGRLARGRKLLARRLTNRGVVLSAASLAALLAQGVALAGVPASVASKTIEIASLTAAGLATSGVIPVRVAALTEGVMKAMFASKLRTAVETLVAVLCVIGIGAALVLGKLPDLPQRPDEVRQAEAKEATLKATRERFQGTWKCVSMHCDGVKSEPDMTCTIKGNTWETKLDGRMYQSGTFKLVDLDASPKQIEWVITFAEAEEDKDKTCHGIFMLDGDSFCWVASDAAKCPRPQAFFTQKDDGCCAGMFKRADPK